MENPDRQLAPVPADGPEERDLTDRLIARVEHAVYIALAVLLSVATLLALVSTFEPLVDAVKDWSSGDGLHEVIDRLLVGLMMVEILHTVRASIRSGVLNGEPFLVVGLIASIRRMLVITLDSTQAARNPSIDLEKVFRDAMIELGVQGVLVLVLVVSLVLLRRSRLNVGIRIRPPH